MTKAEAEINETAWNYMLRCEKYEKRIAELEAALREIKSLSDSERGGDIYAKMKKVNKHVTAALGK